MAKGIYEECPIYKKIHITIRQTTMEDALELLKCYSDEKSVSLFNSDNCNGDDFHYTTLERMKQAIDFWDFSYKNKYFVRWTVILNDTNKILGTIEMFHRIAEDEFNHYGVLRIDLLSSYEVELIIDEIVEIVNDNFYDLFSVKVMLTKAIPCATVRITSLLKNGFVPLGRKLLIYDDYFIAFKDK